MSSDYIFLVDDDEGVLGTLSRALKRQGYEVNFANNGPDGLTAVKKRMPDLLILDIIMPNMTGIEVCRKIREDEEFNRMPILFLSARTSTDEKVEGLDVGADDYIVKPFEITELNARVRALLRRAQRDGANDLAKIRVGNLLLNSTNYQIELDGKLYN